MSEVMVKRSKVVLAALFGSWSLIFSSAVVSAAETPVAPVKQVMSKLCMNCHKVEDNVIRGYLDGVSVKSKMLQVKLDNSVEIFTFEEDDIMVVNEQRTTGDGELLRDNKIKKGHEVRVEYSVQNGVKKAEKLTAKPPVEVPKEMLITTEEMEKLVKLGPEKGKYYLFDSRPALRFQEGSIPGAVNLPFPAFDKMAEKLLPADKNAKIIFFCSGPSCNMSPGSATKAKSMGYTNLKVYKDGLPAWSVKNYSALSAQFLKEAWLDKDMSHVLLDARPSGSKDFIKGAVCFPAKSAAKLIEAMGLKQKKAPIIIYDAGKGNDAAQVAEELLKAGYGNVKILTGGFDGWKAAKLPTETGNMATKVVYIPKLKPGEMDVPEFTKLISALPENTVIIDVRLVSEANAGMLKGAKNIPLAEIRERVAELPKDKTIVFQCNTGTQAEIAYNMARELGLTNVKFLNANVKFDKNGSYTITKN